MRESQSMKKNKKEEKNCIFCKKKIDSAKKKKSIYVAAVENVQGIVSRLQLLGYLV